MHRRSANGAKPSRAPPTREARFIRDDSCCNLVEMELHGFAVCLCTAICAGALMLAADNASADPLKDESGKGPLARQVWMGRTGAQIQIPQP
jgi:hypothetical protein